MFSVKTLIVAALLSELVLVVDTSFEFGGSRRSYNLDLTKASDLTMLYNSPVYLAFRMERPLGDHHFYIGPFGHIAGQLSHSGVKVNLADGSEWLVHKGKEFGSGSQTVVVDARHMSPYWEVFKTHDFKGTKTVGDFVKTGGNDYHFLFDNCHQAAARMMNQ